MSSNVVFVRSQLKNAENSTDHNVRNGGGGKLQILTF